MRQTSESGAVLAFVAIVLIAIIMFFGFVMDVNMLASSREQAQHFARFASLTALERFHDPDLRCKEVDGALVPTNRADPDGIACTNCQKYELAIAAVNELIPQNAIINKLNYEADQDPTTQKVVPVLYGDPTLASDCALPSPPTGSALLVPGRMVADDIVEGEPQGPCDTSGRRSPCFESFEMENEANSLTPSAFGIQGDYYKGLSHMWSENLLSASAKDLRVDAIATLIPRRGCFLVDLSASSTRNTHIRKELNRVQFRARLESAVEPPDPDPWGNEFAFFLGCPVMPDPLDSDADYMQNCRSHAFEATGDGLGNDEFLAENNMGGSYDWRFGNHSLWSNHDRLWQWLRITHPSDASLRDATHHVRGDYVLKHVYGDADYVSGIHGGVHPDPAVRPDLSTGAADGDGAWFQVDMGYRERSSAGGYSAAPGYDGPEPLRSILAGIETAIDYFQQRQVAGDMACVIFYDKTLTWPRVFNITSNFADLANALNFDSVVDSTFLQPDAATDITITPTAAVSGFEAFVRHGLFPRNPDNSFTNTVAAVSEALSQLAQARQVTGVESADFIVHIGDGLANCLNCTGADAGDGLCTDASNIGTCSNEYPYYKQAIEDLHNMIRNDIWADPEVRNVPIHVFMIGDSVGPHSLDIESEDSTNGSDCVGPEKVGGSGYPAVRGTPGDEATKSDAFDDASELNPFWEANVDWFEIAKLTRGIWAPIRRQFPVGTASCPSLVVDGDGDPCDTDTYGIGGSFRRDFDPFCETKEEQIDRYLELVLGDNPFKLVEPQWEP